MAIIRSARDVHYTTINNTGIRDKRLSFKARGLLSYMLSMPDNWTFHVSELTNHSDKDGRDSIKSAINELEQAGYLIREQARNQGKFTKQDWQLFEVPQTKPDEKNDSSESTDNTDFSPQTGFPSTANPSTVLPSTANPPLLSTYSTKNLNKVVVIIGGSKVELSDEHPLAHYQRAWGRSATGLNNQQIVKFADYFGNELTNYAFDKAALSGHEYSYAVAILRSWHDKGIKTVADAVADEQRHKQQGKSKPAKQQHEQQATPTKTRTKTEAIYKALQVNAGDVDKTLDYFATDGLQITRAEIEAVADERIRA